jgi:hypothetical protein
MLIMLANFVHKHLNIMVIENFILVLFIIYECFLAGEVRELAIKLLLILYKV